MKKLFITLIFHDYLKGAFDSKILALSKHGTILNFLKRVHYTGSLLDAIDESELEWDTDDILNPDSSVYSM
jgi:hypothetical protein